MMSRRSCLPQCPKSRKMDFLDALKEDHRRLLIQIEELERILMGFTDPLSTAARNGIRELLQRCIELLKSHGERETAELFPLLRSHLPEADEWLVGMTEVQDEMILQVARQLLYEFCSGTPSSISVERLREDGARLVRWARMHVRVEEERLFPRLQDLP